jgi:hypothetical protein
MSLVLALAVLLAAAPQAQGGDSTPSILQALQFPALITEARRIGVPEVLLRGVLDELKQRGLPAEEAALVIGEEVDAVKAGGPKDNFGAFVHRQLEAGLRGRALAAAIRAEHHARGIGRPTGRPSGGRDSGRARVRTP